MAVGGDGTVGEVISGVMNHQQAGPCVAIVPGGTGNDIARKLDGDLFGTTLATFTVVPDAVKVLCPR